MNELCITDKVNGKIIYRLLITLSWFSKYVKTCSEIHLKKNG